MADQVIDVVHKLNFEVDSNPIEVLNKEVGTQIKQLEVLAQKQARYTQLLASTSANDIRRQTTLNALLERTKRQYDAVSTSMAKQIDGSQKLTRSVNQLAVNTNGVGIAFANIVRDAPFGIIGVGNNITQAFDSASLAFKQFKAEGLTTGQAFSKIAGSLFTLNTAISLGVTLLTVFGDSLFSAGESAEDAQKNIDDLTKSIDSLIKKEAEYNIGIENIVGTGERALKRELELLKARGATPDEILKKENQIRDVQAKRISEQKGAYEAALEFVIRGAGQSQATIDQLAEKLPQRFREQLVGELRRAQEEGINIEEAFLRKISDLEQEALDISTSTVADNDRVARESLEEQRKRLEKLREKWEELQRTIKEVTNDIKSITWDEWENGARELNRVAEGYERILSALDKYQRDNGVTSSGVLGDDANDIANRQRGGFDASAFRLEVDLRNAANQKKWDAEDKKRRDEAAEKNKQIIQDSLNYTLNTTISTLQQIYDAQLYYLDLELQARRTRVDEATELAKRGNTEVLEAEKNRLVETEKEREKVARKQLQLNALLQASSAAIAATQAIQTVTNAGATGDPYTAAARIAAAVAALAAGFAFATNLTTAFNNNSFKDGVIGINGAGTETSDSIPARLSRGESVMTAAETKKYRPYLEAMRDGTFDRVAVTKDGIVTSKQDKNTTKELQEIKEAINGLSFNASQKMDKNGISQVVETAIRQNRTKWRG